MQLRTCYQAKYCSEYDRPASLSEAILNSRAQHATSIVPFEVREIRDVVEGCLSKKSTGPDGISYEAIRALMVSEVADEISDLFNNSQISWLRNVVVFLPKVPAPSLPKHLRPIVLSSCFAKVFTKPLLQRIRPDFPPLRCGQLCARMGGQVMDGALAAQQLTYISAEHSLPLLMLISWRQSGYTPLIKDKHHTYPDCSLATSSV